MREHYEALLKTRDEETEARQQLLQAQEQELEALRRNAKETADGLRKQMEALRRSSPRDRHAHGPTTAAAWKAFETGVMHYQSQQWPQAARAFEDCLGKDSRWGAAYQYLALAYHAQGKTEEAARVAARAKELDPQNTQLAGWVDRLQTVIQQRKAS